MLLSIFCPLVAACVCTVGLDATTSYGPWGSDAGLAHHRLPVQSMTPPASRAPIQWAVRTLVAFHQWVLGPTTAPRSHFRPSSSQYMLLAVQKYGALGVLRGLDRLMRENDEEWIYPRVALSPSTWMKWDPP